MRTLTLFIIRYQITTRTRRPIGTFQGGGAAQIEYRRPGWNRHRAGAERVQIDVPESRIHGTRGAVPI